jgi:Flp pilus assembly protein TadD
LDQAIHEFRESVRLNPTDPLAHNNLGNDLAKNGQMEEAIREFRAALRLDPACEPAKKNLAQALGQPLPP